MFRLLLLMTILWCSADTCAQVVDSVQMDTLRQEESVALSEYKAKHIQHPKRALMWAIVPGGGQVYNRRWWKVPLVFSAFTGVAAVLDFNESNYRRFKAAYDLELAGQVHEFTGIIDGANRLKVFRDDFNKARQTNYFMLLAVYALQGVEAYVDAHLRHFDVDDDLSYWQLKPQIIPTVFSPFPAVGLGVQYNF